MIALFKALLTITDEQAMWRVQTNDDGEAFALLVRRWEGPIQSLCTRMLGDLHRGQDVAQEAFARIYAKRKGYQSRAKFSTYLWRVAMNLCYDELRRQKRRGEVPIETEGDEGLQLLDILADEKPHPSEEIEGDDEAARVRRAVAELPDIYRSVLVLRHYEDLKFREIAEVLEIAEGTVKSRMAEAMNMLSRKLTRKNSGAPTNTIRAQPRENRSESLML